MTPQEQQLIDSLTDRVRSTRLDHKDPDADRRLHNGLASSPDALYILAQAVLGLQMQMKQARQQLDQLQSELANARSTQQPQPQTSSNWQNTPTYQPVPPPSQVPQPYPEPSYSQPTTNGGGFFGGGGGGGGFLHNAMAAAAGVMGGELLFHGLEDAISGFGRSEHERFDGNSRNFDSVQDDSRDPGGLGDVNYDAQDDASRNFDDSSSDNSQQGFLDDSNDWSDSGNSDAGFDDGNN